MKTIQLEIEDKSLELFLVLINNLKDGIVKKFEIKDSAISDREFQETKAYFQECLYDIENKKVELLSQVEYESEMGIFVQDLKSRYANS